MRNISSLFASLCLFLLFASVVLGQSAKASAQDAAPSKMELIKTLKSLFSLLEEKDFSAASEYLVLPPDFKPEMLDGFIERQEISLAGILELENAAKFGSAIETFGDERARYFAKRATVEVSNCYGFNHQAGDVTAEVLAYWNGTQFKLIRLDDVGKLSTSMETPTNSPDRADSVAKALPVFEKAVAENPDDVAIRARYAMALYQTGNLPAAWAQLVQARKLQPDHAGIANGMGVILSEFENEGLFSVGTPAEEIEKTLGQPQQKVDLQSRERWVYGYLGVDFASQRVHEIVDLRGATEALYHPTEIVEVELDGRGWTCGQRKKFKNYSTAFYYLPNENKTNWSEEFEIERILNGAQVGSVEAIGKLIVAQISTRHPDSTHQILGQDEDSVIVAFVLPETPNFQKRHQLVRLIMGPVDVHRIAYTIKVDQPSSELQSTWLGIMKAAKLVEVGNEK